MYKQNFVAVIKCNGKILREQDNDVVYLPFGTEYSILLKNKDSRRALVDIEVDGKNVLNGYKIIINGDDTQEIKGFMKDMTNTNKFRFIHKTEEIQQHRGDRIDDGLIRITYQFEKCKPEPVYIDPLVYRPRFNSYSTYTYGYDCGRGSTNLRDCGDVWTMNCCSVPLSDEGITVKGNEINQNYSYGSIDSLESNVYTMVFHLKGLTKSKTKVKSPITTKVKLKCSSCGRKNKSFNKFCYNCGTFLE
jgi:hypothetical protein